MTIPEEAKRRAWKLVEGYSDVGLAAAKDEVADLLECDPSDVDSALADLGMERCGSCGIWHAQEDCSIEHPEFPMDFICQSCADHLGHDEK